ncbi:glycosyltransferase [Clostridium beijerinckii]|uniref:glycosyltransferase n=1 Tax=Clostridium beijerinckii TaxID=1520 RepID=UPI0022E419A5|nr:glycosyltransferase [Clostridium beijerinckii]
MNKNIVICINPFVSHFTPTLLLAKRLKELGHRVVYLGFADMESTVRQHGFDYLAIRSIENRELVNLKKQNSYKLLAEAYYKVHVEIKELLEESQVDLVMIGQSRFLIYLLPSILANIKVLFYSLCAGEPMFNLRCPPVTSDYVPKVNGGSKTIYFLKWFGRFLRKELAPCQLFTKLFYPWPELFRMCREHNIQWKFGIDGFFPAFPIIVFGTKYLEFGSYNENLQFVGLCVDKKEDIADFDAYLSFADNNKPLIYCCLGTMSSRYPNGNDFLSAVVELFKQNPQWNLLLSLGKYEDHVRVDKPANNIHIVNFVQQLEVLQHTDLALIHGGHATVKECIYSKVPMLVFSCSYDQHGNAARIHYHQIGAKSPMLKRTLFQRLFCVGKRKVTSEEIELLIKRVLNQEKYSNNICSLHDKINQDNELDDTVGFILEKCNTSYVEDVK